MRALGCTYINNIYTHMHVFDAAHATPQNLNTLARSQSTTGETGPEAEGEEGGTRVIAVKDPAHMRRDVGADAPMLVKNAVPVPKDIMDDKVGSYFLGGLVYARWWGVICYTELSIVISYHTHTHTHTHTHIHTHTQTPPSRPPTKPNRTPKARLHYELSLREEDIDPSSDVYKVGLYPR